MYYAHLKYSKEYVKQIREKKFIPNSNHQLLDARKTMRDFTMVCYKIRQSISDGKISASQSREYYLAIDGK